MVTTDKTKHFSGYNTTVNIIVMSVHNIILNYCNNMYHKSSFEPGLFNACTKHGKGMVT